MSTLLRRGCEIRIKYGKAKECELEKLPLLINQEGKKISLTSDFWISFLSKWKVEEKEGSDLWKSFLSNFSSFITMERNRDYFIHKLSNFIHSLSQSNRYQYIHPNRGRDVPMQECKQLRPFHMKSQLGFPQRCLQINRNVDIRVNKIKEMQEI